MAIILLSLRIVKGMKSHVEEIGQIIILLDERLGSGRFGSVFPVKSKGVTEEIEIKKIEKKKVNVDSSLDMRLNGTNYSTDEDEFM